MPAAALTKPSPSPLTRAITSSHAQDSVSVLPLEILHNLRFHHKWVDLKLHVVTEHLQLREISSREISSRETSITDNDSIRIVIISGLPPRHSYLHPDFQNHIVRQEISEKSVTVQREWIAPMSLGEKWSLRKFSKVFDALPERRSMEAEEGVELGMQWTDAKRMLLGMLAINGMGGDGTIAYYIMQEGEVKPRQNG